MVMKKLLYIAPHLSTGGLPQYLYKKIELLQEKFDIYLVEWDNHTGGRLVVQRNKITNLLSPDHFFTLNEDKKELLHIIDQIKPDIIHLEEIPEFFMDYNLAEKIYNTDRSYSIIETSHDSSYDTTQKKFFPLMVYILNHKVLLYPIVGRMFLSYVFLLYRNYHFSF